MNKKFFTYCSLALGAFFILKCVSEMFIYKKLDEKIENTKEAIMELEGF